MPIEIKTVAMLVDELITTSMKIFGNLDRLDHLGDEDAGRLFKETQTLNRRRTRLMKAIDEKLGEGEDTVTDKTYR